MFKSMMPKKPPKDQRERLVLVGLVQLYLQTGQPVGSTTLRDHQFKDLSPATIRNYFAKLESLGFLRQQHSSGGRIPTESAYKLYIDKCLSTEPVKTEEGASLEKRLTQKTREVATYLQEASEHIAQSTQCAVFVSSPRFDHDFVLDVKLVAIDMRRCLCVLITDFGMVHTELLYADETLNEGLEKVNLKTIAQYLQWRISGLKKPKISPKEEKLAAQFYKEIMLRHIVSHSNFSKEDIYKTGFSKLLEYPDFNNAAALAGGLSLFENDADLHTLITKTMEKGSLSCLIGNDLDILKTPLRGCSILLIPYKIHQAPAGVIALLGPNRLPYETLFSQLTAASKAISKTLTDSLYKFKITFRKPKEAQVQLEQKDASWNLLIENKD